MVPAAPAKSMSKSIACGWGVVKAGDCERRSESLAQATGLFTRYRHPETTGREHTARFLVISQAAREGTASLQALVHGVRIEQMNRHKTQIGPTS
jgi:hypothetical protein